MRMLRLGQPVAQRIHALAGHSRHCEHGRIRERRACKQFADFGFDSFNPLRGHAVALGDDDSPHAHGQQLHDV